MLLMSPYLTRRKLAELDARLTDRDREIAGLVNHLRLVSGRQLQRLYFAHGGVPASQERLARSALARLVELEVLTRLERPVGGVRGGSGAWVYEAGPAAQRLFAYWRGDGFGRVRPSHEPGQRFVRHTLAVSEIYTRVREAARDGRFEFVDFHAEPDCWRSGVGPGGNVEVLKPDAFVQLAHGEFLDAWLLEIDLATESSRVLHRQCVAYARYFQTGREQRERGVFPRVLWIVPDQQRGDLLTRVLAGLPAETRELFTVTTEAAAVEVMALGAGSTEEPS
jgi:hypothetical protein